MTRKERLPFVVFCLFMGAALVLPSLFSYEIVLDGQSVNWSPLWVRGLGLLLMASGLFALIYLRR